MCYHCLLCFFFSLKQQQPLRPILVETSCPNIRMDPKLCPADPNWIAFIHSNDIWISNIETREERRLTFVHNGNASSIKISTPLLHLFLLYWIKQWHWGFFWNLGNGHSLFHLVCHVLCVSSSADIVGWFFSLHCGIWQNELFVEYIWKGSITETHHIPFYWNCLFCVEELWVE